MEAIKLKDWASFSFQELKAKVLQLPQIHDLDVNLNAFSHRQDLNKSLS